jgi:hypothetical protein
MFTDGPMSIEVCIESNFQSYGGGIYGSSSIPACNASNINHALLLVGYDMSGPTPYWIAKNQVAERNIKIHRIGFIFWLFFIKWNTNWGIKGYINIQMNRGYVRIPIYPTFLSSNVNTYFCPVLVTSTTSTFATTQTTSRTSTVSSSTATTARLFA